MTPDEISDQLATNAILNLVEAQENKDAFFKPLFEGQCEDGYHSVLVYAYMAGQIRIRLTDKRQVDIGAPEGHGSIVRELDSYKRDVAADCISMLLGHADPPYYAESLAKPWNTGFSGDRIRLDNEPSMYRPS